MLQYIFISYSRKDQAYVSNLQESLNSLGVEIWIDKLNLTPGTTNWENAIRTAIQSCDFLVLVASPNSRLSDFVQGEIAIAQRFNKPIIPVWIEGNHWVDCVPMDLSKLQAIDSRSNSVDDILKVAEIILAKSRTKRKTLTSERPEVVEIQAHQVIYTRVESEYSPTRNSGYQVVYKSKEFRDEVVSHIITSMLLSTNEPRYQYKVIDKENIIIVFSDSIRSNITMDVAGRPATIVHGLLISLKDFELAENNPFLIIDNDPFVRSAEQFEALLSDYGIGSGVAPSLSLKLDLAMGNNFDWDEIYQTELKNIQEILPEIHSNKRKISLVGNYQKALEVLKYIFSQTQASTRLLCSFHTHIESTANADQFLFIVSKRSSNVTVAIEINVNLKRITKPYIRPINQVTASIATEGRRNHTPFLFETITNFIRNRILGKTVMCPHCLAENRIITGIACRVCGFKIPSIYVDNYKHYAPFFLQIMGHTNTGKTTYLHALTFLLLDLASVWRGFSCMAVTERSQEFVREARSILRRGNLPQSTSPVGHYDEAYVMTMNNLPRWDDRPLIIRDFAGELFQSFDLPTNVMPYLLTVPTVMLFISLADYKNDNTIDMLFASYIHTLLSSEIDLAKNKRSIVVVITKGDLLNLPSKIENYLMNDELSSAIFDRSLQFDFSESRLDEYIERMEEISTELEFWLKSKYTGFNNFSAQARAYNISVKYSITSVRSEVFGETLGSLTMNRILDPLFWSLDLSNP